MNELSAKEKRAIAILKSYVERGEERKQDMLLRIEREGILEAVKWADRLMEDAEIANVCAKALKDMDEHSVIDVLTQFCKDISGGLLRGYFVPCSTSPADNAVSIAKNRAHAHLNEIFHGLLKTTQP